jgi:DNA-directed RNA polymerase subunit K/omega
MNVEPVDLRIIDERAANIYEALIITAKRARQINDEYKMEYNALVSTIPTSTTDDDSEDIENPIQLKIALELENHEKPHLQALNELLEGKIQFDYKK